MILALHFQLLHTFVQQMFSNTPFFFPYKLDLQLRNAKFFKKFRNTLLKLGQPTPNLIHITHHPLGLKLLTKLRLGLTHLNKNRFKHNSENFINQLYTFSLEVESTKHFLLHCHHYSALCTSFLNALKNISPQLVLLREDVFLKTLLCGFQFFDKSGNYKIPETLIRYILDSKTLSASLL